MKETPCLVDMFLENRHTRTFAENLFKDYSGKKKSKETHSYTQIKCCRYMLLDQKLVNISKNK